MKLGIAPVVGVAIITAVSSLVGNIFGSKKTTYTYTPLTTPPPTTITGARQPSPTIMGIPQNTALLIGAGVGIYLLSRRDKKKYSR